MHISPKQLAAVSALPGPARYEHFIKRVADTEEAWGLFSEGWALVGDAAGQQVFPLWPAREYAEACATESWTGYQPRAIGLEDLTGALLPKLEGEGVQLGVFLLPSGKGVVVPAARLSEDLDQELAQYE